MFKQVDEKQKELEEQAKKAEEAKQEESKVEEKNPDDVDLTAPIIYGENNLKKIEEERKKFLKTMKKGNIIKWIVSFSSITLLVVGWLVFLPKSYPLKAIAYVFTGVALGVIIAYFFINKKISGNKMEAYLKEYYGIVNSHVLSNKRFSCVNGDVNGKVDAIEFNESGLYKDATQIGSRNLINFKIDGKVDVKMCDLAAQKATQKKLVPLFIGKYLIANNNYQGDKPIFIYLPGNSRSLPPNNLDALPKVVNTKKMVVYTSNNTYEKTFNAKVRQNISKIITNNILVDACFAITKGKTYIGLGYDDCLMVLPYGEQFNPKPIERFNTDMEIISNILVELQDLK